MDAHLAIATLSAEIAPQAPDSFRLLPAGAFRASDGRPEGLEAWVLDQEDMARLVADAMARDTDYPIDYEHQILEARNNGQPAPAAGWFRRLEARDDGLYATDVRWTVRARQMIEAGEYRYISPVFTYDRRSGRVTRLVMAALTNHPALDGLTDLAPLTEEFPMTDILSALRQALSVPEDGDAVAAAIEALKARDAEIAALKGEIERLKAASIPMSEHAKLQAELAALRADMEAAERERLIEAALADGRILPSQRDYWENQPLAALKAWLAVAQPIAALTQSQSDGRVASNAGKALTEEQEIACRIGGWAAEVFQG